MDLAAFYARFIDLTDRVLPALHHPSDQIIFLQLFSRTIAVDQETCRLSYRDLSDLGGLSQATVKTSLRRLIDHGVVKVVGQASAKVAQTYQIIWPTELKRMARLQRHPNVLLKETGIGYTESILEQLSEEDREVLDLLKSTMPLEDEKFLRRQAAETAAVGQAPEDKYLELIVLTKFGPERLKKYE